MSTNFKVKIRNRYKGRGNCWVKVPNDSVVFQKVINSLNNVDASEYLGHIEREGFAWIRFSKPGGNEKNPVALYEIRYKGSKIDHPDTIISIEDDLAKDLPLLGNTPVKLQLEVDPSERKQLETKPQLKRKNIVDKINVLHDEEIIEDKIKVIEVSSLTKPTSAELNEWKNFLLEEGLLDYSF